MSDLPRVTVVIPCYNHAEYVVECINSVVKQDYQNKRICVVDANSSDNSYDRIISAASKYEEQDNITVCDYDGVSVFVIRRNKYTGPSEARNIAIETMWEHTDIFGVLDADDLYLEGKLTASVEKMAEDMNTIGLVYSDVLIYRQHDKFYIHEFRPPFNRNLIKQECIISNAPLINKAALEICGKYDVDMRTAEDWDLWLRITGKFVAVHIPKPLQVYRVTGHNASDVVNSEVWQENWSKIAQRLQIGYYG